MCDVIPDLPSSNWLSSLKVQKYVFIMNGGTLDSYSHWCPSDDTWLSWSCCKGMDHKISANVDSLKWPEANGSCTVHLINLEPVAIYVPVLWMLHGWSPYDCGCCTTARQLKPSRTTNATQARQTLLLHKSSMWTPSPWLLLHPN